MTNFTPENQKRPFSEQAYLSTFSLPGKDFPREIVKSL